MRCVLASAAVIVLVLSACAPEPGGARPSRQGAASTDPTPSASASATPSATTSPFPKGVIARGAFAATETGAADGITGEVEVLEHPDDRVTFRVVGLQGTPDDAAVLLQPGSRVGSVCADEDVVDYGPVSYVPDGSERPVALEPPFADPTIWKAVVLAVPDDPEGAGCVRTIVAAAPLEWGIEPQRAELADLVDGGPRPGAEGGVSTAGGRIYAYLVAPGDVLSLVAERFGVRNADILALNPFRADPLETGLYADEVLNLSLDLR